MSAPLPAPCSPPARTLPTYLPREGSPRRAVSRAAARRSRRPSRSARGRRAEPRRGRGRGGAGHAGSGAAGARPRGAGPRRVGARAPPPRCSASPCCRTSRPAAPLPLRAAARSGRLPGGRGSCGCSPALCPKSRLRRAPRSTAQLPPAERRAETAPRVVRGRRRCLVAAGPAFPSPPLRRRPGMRTADWCRSSAGAALVLATSSDEQHPAENVADG